MIDLKTHAVMLRLTSSLERYADSHMNHICQDDVTAVLSNDGNVYDVLAYSTSQLIDLLRLLTVSCWMYHQGLDGMEASVPKEVIDKVGDWATGAKAVLKDSKVPVKYVDVLKNVIMSMGDPTPAPIIKRKLSNSLMDIQEELTADELSKDEHITSDYLKMFKAIALFIRKPSSTGAWKNISSKARLLRDHDLTHIFLPSEIKGGEVDTSHYDALHRYIDTIFKTKGKTFLTKSDVDRLTDEQKAKLRELAKPANQVWSSVLKKIVTESGQPHLPIEEVRRSMEQMGLPTHRIPQTTVEGIKGALKSIGVERGRFPKDEDIIPFNGRINEAGEIFTDKGKKLSQSPMGGYIRRHPAYNSNLDNGMAALSRGWMNSPDKDEQKLYTQDYTHGTRAEGKHEKTDELIAKLPQLRSKWTRDLNQNADVDKKRLAAIMELLYATSLRIGNTGAAEREDNPTFGISTWRPEHLKALPNGGMNISHAIKGKGDSYITINLKPTDAVTKKAIEVAMNLRGSHKRGQYIWVNKRNVPFSRATINNYLKGLGYSGSVHKFRHAQGTSLFKDMIKSNPLKTYRGEKPTLSEIERHHKSIVTAIGQKLGHIRMVNGVPEPTGATARINYIDPVVQAEWYRSHGINPLPKWLENLTRRPETE